MCGLLWVAEDKKHYVIKQIDISSMSTTERRDALQEVTRTLLLCLCGCGRERAAACHRLARGCCARMCFLALTLGTHC